jgi:hypothetical protein
VLVPMLVLLRGQARWPRWLMSAVLYVGVFLAISPGALIEPVRFSRDVIYEMRHYALRGHDIYTVQPGWPHLQAMLDYLAFSLSSPIPLISALLGALAVYGAGAAYRARRDAFLILCIIPTLYVLYLSSQRVMIVRNLLVVLPFVALLLAWAVQSLTRSKQPLQWLAFCGLSGVCITSAMHFKASSDTLLEPSANAHTSTHLRAFMDAHPGSTIAISRSIHDELMQTGTARKWPSAKSTGRAEHLVYRLGEFQIPPELATRPPYLAEFANRRGIYQVLGGANDIDINFYPSWSGKSRILVVSGTRVEQLMKLKPQDVGVTLAPGLQLTH